MARGRDFGSLDHCQDCQLRLQISPRADRTRGQASNITDAFDFNQSPLPPLVLQQRSCRLVRQAAVCGPAVLGGAGPTPATSSTIHSAQRRTFSALRPRAIIRRKISARRPWRREGLAISTGLSRSSRHTCSMTLSETFPAGSGQETDAGRLCKGGVRTPRAISRCS